MEKYKDIARRNEANIWIIKPGENSNRGHGIQITDSLPEICSIINSYKFPSETKGRPGLAGSRTWIVQKYIDRPLLIDGRKFDIRGFGMITSINGVIKGYMYRDCYFRTSSKKYDLANLNRPDIHLTNDAVQKTFEDYGKFENDNKLSISDF